MVELPKKVELSVLSVYGRPGLMALAVKVCVVRDALEHRTARTGHHIAILLPVPTIVFPHLLSIILRGTSEVHMATLGVNGFLTPTFALRHL